MWVWTDATEVGNSWQKPELLELMFSYLKIRSINPTAWLDDHAKYIDIRFDSRTGHFNVQDWFNRKFLIWKE
jgi:hypothetical protein